LKIQQVPADFITEEWEKPGMGRGLKSLLISTVLFSPVASAQITGGGYYESYSLVELFSEVIGIQISNPYELGGILATLGVLWVSTYIVFKSAITFMDENLDEHNDLFADAVGLSDPDDRNILAVLTLLIVLTMLGTMGFAGIINGWQSIIILTFLFGMLAAFFLIIFGGTGAAIGGAALGAGVGARATAEGVNQLQDALNDIELMEEREDEEEGEAEDDLDQGDDEQADRDARVAEEDLEDIVNALEGAIDELDDLVEEEYRELGQAIENLEETVQLLDLED
jgi:hypothetical protein